MWLRADRSGPLRAGHIVAAAEQFDRACAAAGSDRRVVIDLSETDADGWALIAVMPMLDCAGFMPNRAKIAQHDAITFTGVRTVETHLARDFRGLRRAWHRAGEP